WFTVYKLSTACALARESHRTIPRGLSHRETRPLRSGFARVHPDGPGYGRVKRMAEPARGSADGSRPERPAEAVPGPGKLIWADVQSDIIASLHAAERAVTVLAG